MTKKSGRQGGTDQEIRSRTVGIVTARSTDGVLYITGDPMTEGTNMKRQLCMTSSETKKRLKESEHDRINCKRVKITEVKGIKMNYKVISC
jgi:hypothetical protein